MLFEIPNCLDSSTYRDSSLFPFHPPWNWTITLLWNWGCPLDLGKNFGPWSIIQQRNNVRLQQRFEEKKVSEAIYSLEASLWYLIDGLETENIYK